MWEVKPICSERVTTSRKAGECLSLKKSAEILSQLDIPSNRLLFQLVPSPLPTEETESSSSHTTTKFTELLQTPRVVQTYEDPEKFLARKEKNGYRNGTMYSSLESQVKFHPKFKDLLKTPAAIDAMMTSPKKNPTPGDSGTLAQEIMCGYVEKRGFMLPTPTTTDYNTTWSEEAKQACLERRALEGKTKFPSKFNQLRQMATDGRLPQPENSSQIVSADSPSEDGKNSRLNPLFVEEMMGFPLMWTAYPFLSTNGETKP